MRDKALKAMRDALNAQFSDTISPLGIRTIASHALTAYESHLQAEGMAVVPVEPTAEMVDAGWNQGVPSEIWKAMLAAHTQEKDNG